MNIAICDDDIRDIKYLKEQIIETWNRREEIHIYEFFKGEDLLESKKRFDIVFLDIEMGGELDGTQAAKLFSQRSDKTLLAFYTAHDFPASKIVDAQPVDYIVKGTPTEEIRFRLKKILQKSYETSIVPSLPVTYNGKMIVIKLQDILFISIFEKGSLIWLTDERGDELSEEVMLSSGHPALKSSEKLKTYYEKLKNYGFIYAKKSYIINASHISRRQRESVILTNGTELTVARSQKKQFDEKMMAYFASQYH